MNSSQPIPQQLHAVGLIALSGCLYGFLGFFGTQLLHADFSVANMLFWRFFIAALWMAGWGVWRHENFLNGAPTWRACIAPILLGAVCYGGASLIYFFAAQQIGTGLAMVIFFSYPMFVALFALIKNQWRIHPLTVISLVAIMIGLLLLKQNEAHVVTTLGILLAILSALFYATYVFRCSDAMSGMLSSHFTVIICLSSATLLFFMAYFTHTFTFPKTLSSWEYVIALSIFATAIPIQLLLEGLKSISPLKASILSVLEPVVTLLIGIALLNESISHWQALGIIILLLGAIMIQFARD